MKTKYLKISAISLLFTGQTFAASATLNIAAGELRDASGGVIPDNGGVWAVIVAAGQPGNPQTAGSLPGGLTMGTSLGNSNITAALNDFKDVELTVGSKGDYYFLYAQNFTSNGEIGVTGMAFGGVSFPVNALAEPGFASGTPWGLYWFPGKSVGDTLSTSFDVGGFANAANTASGGEWGTTVPDAGATWSANFYETQFNQDELGESDTGLPASRFTAIAVPEPTSMTLSVLGLAALLRRRRK